MKLVCKGEYHNTPHELHFGPGVIEVDDWKAEFLMRDAPENFERYAASADADTKAPDEPARDKQVKAPPRKK